MFSSMVSTPSHLSFEEHSSLGSLLVRILQVKEDDSKSFGMQTESILQTLPDHPMSSVRSIFHENSRKCVYLR